MGDRAFVELEGKPLAFWLQELLAEESGRRSAAAMLLTRSDNEFNTAVYAAVNAPEFPREAWLYALVDFLFWAQETRMAAYRREQDRSNRVWEKLQQRYPTPQALQNAPNRMRRWFHAPADPKNRYGQEQETLLTQQVAARVVLDAAGRHILAVPSCLRRMLADKHYRVAATNLLCALGSHALEEFGADAMAEPNFSAHALAALIRKSPEHIREIAARLQAPVPAEGHWHTLRVLALLGPVAYQAAPEYLPTLVALLDIPECRAGAIHALGTITRGQGLLVDRFLELSYSDDIWTKKAALEALGTIALCPKQVVPRLIAAFDDYKEPDPDDTYYSQHTVVVQALERFGAKATDAVPALVARIVQEDKCITIGLDGTRAEEEVIDPGVVRCLIAIGPAALPALSILERYISDFAIAALEAGEDEEGYWDSPASVAVYRLRQYAAASQVGKGLYVYLGKDKAWAQTDRCQVSSKAALQDWLQKTFCLGPRYPAALTLTYVVLPPGELWIAERHSEHVSCARGMPVLAAGELTLEGLAVVEISNLSTGYCPQPECWPAVQSALDAAELNRPAAFTQSFIFRYCANCQQRQIVRENDFTCCFCGSSLSVQ